MKIHEFIEHLQEYNQEATVILEDFQLRITDKFHMRPVLQDIKQPEPNVAEYCFITWERMN